MGALSCSDFHHFQFRLSLYFKMKVRRIVFYLIAILTLWQVLEVQFLFKDEAIICFSSDWPESSSPIEEDESREAEDDDDLFCNSVGDRQGVWISTLLSLPSPLFQLPEPIQSIPVPPPQA